MAKEDKAADNKKSNAPTEPEGPFMAQVGVRETIESLVIAIILAFLFRGFEAEAFVIPTGSMAPTLMGRHHDLVGAKSGYPFQVGASERQLAQVGLTDPKDGLAAAVDPISRYMQAVNPGERGNDTPFSGDRILVNKLAYLFNEPERWDVIVFKNPGNAKQNYIKRLVGLEQEVLAIYSGDIYTKPYNGEDFTPAPENVPPGKEYTIARKNHAKLKAMLQLVDDTEYLSPELVEIGWPSRWQDWSPNPDDPSAGWKTSEDGKTFTLAASPRESWLRYSHIVPSQNDWLEMDRTGSLPNYRPLTGQLITDFYAYNAGLPLKEGYQPQEVIDDIIRAARSEDDDPNENNKIRADYDKEFIGYHWVSDLAEEMEVQVESDSGEVILAAVEGGDRYVCRIDVKTGTAKLSINDGEISFTETKHPAAQTAVKGPGTYRLMFANADDQLYLWVNGKPVEFDSPATYPSRPNVKPVWKSAEEPGDLAPLAIGGKDVALKVNHLRVYRDVYYIADNNQNRNSDYTKSIQKLTFYNDIRTPATWDKADAWQPGMRRKVEFPIADEQFFPMGDNSPHSLDARIWNAPNYVERRFLTGKAFFIFWPHPWTSPIPLTPNFSRMNLIR